MASDPERLLYLGRAENELTLARTLPQANRKPAEESVRHAERFLKSIIPVSGGRS